MEKGETVEQLECSSGTVCGKNEINNQISTEAINSNDYSKNDCQDTLESNFTEESEYEEGSLVVDNTSTSEDNSKINDDLPPSNSMVSLKADHDVIKAEAECELIDDEIIQTEVPPVDTCQGFNMTGTHSIECVEEIVIEEDVTNGAGEHNLEETVENEAEDSINGHDKDRSDISEDEINENEKNIHDNNPKDENCSVLVSRPDQTNQNFQNAILEDWDADNGTYPTGTNERIVVTVKSDDNLDESVEVIETENSDVDISNENVIEVKVFQLSNHESSNLENAQATANTLITPTNGISPFPPVIAKPRLFFSTSNVTRKEVIDEILRSKSSPAILPKKDLILAMELAKHSTQGPCVENIEEQDEHDILQILEGDQVGDWRGSIAVPAERAGNDLDIGQEVIFSKQLPNNRTKRSGRPKGLNSETLRETKRKRMEERARQRKVALEQLAKEFKERTPVRRRPAKDAPNIAAVDLKRVLASTPVIMGKRKRRPCYQPPADDDPSEEELKDPQPSSAILKTYTPKPRASNPSTDIQTELETIAIVKKHLAQDERIDEIGAKKIAKKVKSADSIKKPGRELQKLLGDEGAVRMLYDAAQKRSPSDNQPNRVLKHTKKELEKKAKFVENAVLYSSGASEKALRGKRLVAAVSEDSPPAEPLFPPALPDDTSSSSLVPVKAKKKPKPAEASRILYRHSSSESFDGSEGLRRSVSELSGIDVSIDRHIPYSPAKNESISLPQRKSSRPRKVSSKLSEYVADTIIPKKIKKIEEPSDKLEPVTFSTPKTIKHHNKRIVRAEVAAPCPVKKTPMETNVKNEYPDVKVTEKDGLVEITLSSHNSSFQNALTEGVIHQLKEALDTASSNPSCKAILLKSKKKVFCQGIDLGILAPGFDVNSLVNSIKSLATTLIFMEKPIIVGVRGVAVGMGVALLPLCDVVVASEDSSFYTPYGRLGHGPEAASSFTFPRIGKALVSELIYKGSVLSADEAFQLGLISQVVSSAKFDAELNQVVDAIVSQNYVALQQSKQLIFGADQQNMVNALDRECDALLKSWSNPECLSAVAEYLASGELLSNS